MPEATAAFSLPPHVGTARAAVLQQAPGAVMVGGAVRDLLLDRPIHDLDFVVEGDGLAVARAVADANGWAFYPLDAGRGFGRALWRQPRGEVLVIDVATVAAGGLDPDLAGRDFTINAMAVLPDGTVVDPLAGRAALASRTLSACSPTSLSDDPVRILRAVRMLGAFQLEPDARLPQQVADALPGLVTVSAERQRDELCRLLALPDPHQALAHLDAWGALPAFMPELAALQDVSQSPPHIHGAYHHTLAVLHSLARFDGLIVAGEQPADAFEQVLVAGLSPWRDPFRAFLQTDLSAGRPAWLSLRFAAVAHDWGKALTRTIDPDGRIRFFGHEQESARLVASWMERFRFASAETTFVKSVCGGHMRPVLLAQTGWVPSRRSLHRFYRDFGAVAPAIALLYAADTLATYGRSLPLDVWRQIIGLAAELLAPAFTPQADSLLPKPLLNGHEIMALTGLPAGPQLGDLLERLTEAQAVGDITTRPAAESFILRLASQPSPGP